MTPSPYRFSANRVLFITLFICRKKICLNKNAFSKKNIKEKFINTFYKKQSEFKDCNRARGLKFYYENKDKVSKQQKLYYAKNGDNFYCKRKRMEVYKLET